MHTFRSARVGPVLQLTTRVAGLAVSLVTVAISARELGPAAYGVLALGMVVAQLLAALTDSGVYPLALVELSRAGGQRADAWAIVRARLLLCAVALPAVALLGAVLLSDEALVPLVIAGSSCLAYAFVGLRAVSEARGHAVRVGLVLLSQNLAWLIAVVVCAAQDLGVTWFAVGFHLSVIVQAVCAYIAAREGTGRNEGLPQLKARNLLRRALPLTASGLLSTVYYRGHFLLVASSLGSVALGNYSAAMRLIDSAQALPATFISIYLPTVSKRFANDSFTLGWLRKFVTPWALLVTCFTLCCMVFPAQIVSILWGSEFMGATELLPVLGIVFMVICIAYAASSTLVALDASKTVAVITGVGSTIGISIFVVLRERLTVDLVPSLFLGVEATITLGLLAACALKLRKLP